jgi:hypothetical protein
MAFDCNPPPATTRRALLLLEGFVAVAAAIGGIGLAATIGWACPTGCWRARR